MHNKDSLISPREGEVIANPHESIVNGDTESEYGYKVQVCVEPHENHQLQVNDL
jgi:hypothetical protein